MVLLQTAQAAPSGWDNLRDWVSALGSLSAALVAAVAFLWSLRGRWPSLAVIIQNNSEEPVHDCLIRIDLARKHWEAAGHRQFLLRRQIVPPGRTEIQDLGLARRDQSGLPVMWFTDSANVRWTRSHTGKLARIVDRGSRQVGWRRVLLWRRPIVAPAVVEQEVADGQNAERPTATDDPPPLASG